MNDTQPSSASMPAANPSGETTSAEESSSASTGFCFTDPGCRTEVRLGALIILASVFLWLWLGPTASSRLYMLGAPLLLIGIPIQAIQAKRDGRPGYPWKLGLTMAIGGALMWPDLRYREDIMGPVHVQEVAPLLLAAGLWILAWWPFARSRKTNANSSDTLADAKDAKEAAI